MKKAGVLVVAAFAGAIAALSLNHFLPQNIQSTHALLDARIPTHKTSGTLAPTVANAIDFTIAAEKTIHGVVHIKTTYAARQNDLYFNDPFRYFFDQQIPQRNAPSQMGAGSGVIVSKDGYIVTNNHVIDDADKIEVILNDKRTYIAELIGTDPTTDLALVKIKEDNLPFISYGNSDDVKVGEWVLAVGNPFNLTSTATAGIVSAKARNINILEGNPEKGLHPVESFIQTDAAVNPGNSGGALVNTKGELIGINSAIASNTGSYTGYSFAIPVNITRKVVADLLEFGEVQRGFIGVSIRDLNAKLAEEKNINELKGVYVDGLTKGGAAEEAGLKPGDIILKIENIEVNNVPELQEQVSRFRPGDKVNVTLKRDKEIKTIGVVLKNRDGEIAIVERSKAEAIASLGAVFEPVTKNEMKKLNIENGLKITKLQAGKLLSIGVKEGFILTSVDKKKINNMEELKSALENKKGGVLLEGIYPNGTKAYYGFGM